MLSSRPGKQLAGALIGLALCVSSTAAGAATAKPSTQISPLVALSAFGTSASASAVRPAVSQPSAANLQMTAAAVQGSPAYAYEESRASLLPVLIGLAVFVAWTIYILTRDEDGEIRLPTDPVSPD